MADAISQVDDNFNGVDLRTVQLWFEDNARGIGQDNIKRLATIFGCGDPDAIRKWRVKLSDSNHQLKLKRHGLRKIVQSEKSRTHHFKLALFTDALFSDRNSLNLVVLLWTGCALIGFLAYMLGVHSITYSPTPGVEKQVGFLWAPSWTLLQLVVLPMFLIFVANLKTFWTETGRSLLVPSRNRSELDQSWQEKVVAFEVSHWAVFFVCFAIVFSVQWAGLYFRPIILGDSGKLILDWSNITTIRPEVMTVSSAVMFSMISFLYAGLCVFLFLTGLLFLLTVSRDYGQLCNLPEITQLEDYQSKARRIGLKLIVDVFRCTILGILIGTCIKVYAVYLNTDATNILTWIGKDLLYTVGFHVESTGWLGKYALGDFSSFLLVFATLLVFIATMVQCHSVFISLRDTSSVESTTKQIRSDFRYYATPIGVVALLFVNFIFVGQFPGFSVLLIASLVLAIHSGFYFAKGRKDI